MRTLKLGDDLFGFKIIDKTNAGYNIIINGQPFCVRADRTSPYELHISVDNVIKKVFLAELVDTFHIVIEGKDYFVPKSASESQSSAAEGSMISPMPGKIIKVLAKIGETVKAGQALIVMEAMKMEHTLKASSDGVIKSFLAKVGEQVPGDTQLVEFEEDQND